jgi:hypothetical protein
VTDNIHINYTDLEKVVAFSKTGKAAAKINREMWKSFKQASEIIVREMQAEVEKAPQTQSPRPRSKGLRKGIAAGLKVQTIRKGQGAGAVIKSTGSGLDGPRKKLVKLYNKPTGWRHPVFAHYGTRSGLKKAIGSSKGDVRKSLRGLDKTLTNRDREKAKWVVQIGRPYFGTVADKHQPQVTALIESAAKTALEQIAAMES